MVELHIAAVSRSWFFHLSYLNLTTKMGAIMEMVIDSDTIRVQVAEVKKMMAFEPALSFPETLAIESVPVHLKGLPFVGNAVEIRLWKLATSGRQPRFLASQPKHIVAQSLPGDRKLVWLGQAPKYKRKGSKRKNGTRRCCVTQAKAPGCSGNPRCCVFQHCCVFQRS